MPLQLYVLPAEHAKTQQTPCVSNCAAIGEKPWTSLSLPDCLLGPAKVSWAKHEVAGLLFRTLRAHNENCAVDCGFQVRSARIDHREWHCHHGASGQAGVELAVGQTNLPERLTCTNLLRTLKSTATIRG